MRSSPAPHHPLRGRPGERWRTAHTPPFPCSRDKTPPRVFFLPGTVAFSHRNKPHYSSTESGRRDRCPATSWTRARGHSTGRSRVCPDPQPAHSEVGWRPFPTRRRHRPHSLDRPSVGPTHRAAKLAAGLSLRRRPLLADHQAMDTLSSSADTTRAGADRRMHRLAHGDRACS